MEIARAIVAYMPLCVLAAAVFFILRRPRTTTRWEAISVCLNLLGWVLMRITDRVPSPWHEIIGVALFLWGAVLFVGFIRLHRERDQPASLHLHSR